VTSTRKSGIQRPLIVTALLACTGCGAPSPQLVAQESNYLTYEHAFTEAAAVEARRLAEATCAKNKRVAVKTSSACSLQRCTTHYQCMDKADADKYRP